MAKFNVKDVFNRAIMRKKHNGIELVIAPASQKFGQLLVITPARIGNAPKRNRVRRRLKEIFSKGKLFMRGYDVIALVKKEGVNLSFDQLKEIMHGAIPC